MIAIKIVQTIQAIVTKSHIIFTLLGINASTPRRTFASVSASDNEDQDISIQYKNPKVTFKCPWKLLKFSTQNKELISFDI